YSTGSWDSPRLVQLRHRYGLRARPAGAALQGFLDDEALRSGTALAAVHLEQVHAEPGVVLAETATTEPARTTRRLRTKPTEHQNSYRTMNGSQGSNSSLVSAQTVTFPPK